MYPIATVTVLIGAPGAGKSTVARSLAADGIAVLSLDEARAIRGEHEGDQRATPAAFAYVAQHLHENLAAARPVAIDGTGARRRDRVRWLRLAGEHGAPATALVVWAPLDVCLERNAARPEHRHVPEHVVTRMWNTIDGLGDDELVDEGFSRVDRVTTALAQDLGDDAE
ncbi:ATP-binding protein [Saccharomonospora sp.]|uniref:ATP-binding protein n=1 Tax=Saccharomonospora sp. TaxID=33913 RepID=UPI0026112BCA|nr:ATP-binding protein [Saccharomonospora sp.]